MSNLERALPSCMLDFDLLHGVFCLWACTAQDHGEPRAKCKMASVFKPRGITFAILLVLLQVFAGRNVSAERAALIHSTCQAATAKLVYFG